MASHLSCAHKSAHSDLVSICIPAYKVRDLRQAIASALAQTYRHIEVIVSDDAPDSAVAELCATFGANIRYVKNQDRTGRGAGNFRNLIRQSKGEYIKFLFDDDFLAPHCVQELVNLARTYPAAHLVTSLYYSVDQDGNNPLVENQLGVTETTVMASDDFVRFVGTHLCNPIGTFSTPLIRRDDLFEAGEPWALDLDGVSYRSLTDIAMWVRLAKRGPIIIHAQPLSFFRIGHGSNSSPDYNPEFIFAVTEWLQLLQNVARSGVLDEVHFARAVEQLRGHYRYHRSSYPRLEQDLEVALSTLRAEFGIDC